jgi:hypothetical protein
VDSFRSGAAPNFQARSTVIVANDSPTGGNPSLLQNMFVISVGKVSLISVLQADTTKSCTD